MPIAFRSYSAGNTSCGVPAGVQDGDMLIWFGGYDGTAATGLPSGFTAIDVLNESVGGTCWLRSAWKIADGESGSYTASNLSACQVLAFSKPADGIWNNPSTAGLHSINDAAGLSVTTTAVTPLNTADMLVMGAANDGARPLNVEPSGMTKTTERINGSWSTTAWYQASIGTTSPVTKSVSYTVSDGIVAAAIVLNLANLSGFNNRIKLNTDADKIDSTLTDFPVMIKLGSAVGRNSEDLTAVFDELAYDHNPASVDDDFTGTNGDPANEKLWNEITNTAGNGTIQSNQFNFNSSETSDDTLNLASHYQLDGDFDIQIDITPGTIATAAADQNILSFGIRDTLASWNVYAQLNYIKDSTGAYKFTLSGSAAETATVTESSLTTKVRIRRVGSALTAWYWKSGAWEWNGNSSGQSFVLSSSVDMFVYLWAKSRANFASEVDYDNFTLNSGLVVWPYELRETFTGTDTDPPDANLWTNSGSEISSNELYASVSGATKYARSKFYLNGNFDIQVDFDISAGPATSGWYLNLIASNRGTGDPNSEDYQMQTRIKYTTAKFYASISKEVSWNTEEQTSTSDTSGKLRITRSGDVFSSYYWNGSSWTQIGSSDTLSSIDDDLEISLRWYSYDGNPTMTATFDNFIINSGNIRWPQGTNPNRKKIGVTTDDGITQCYVEIEHYDEVAETAILWAKLPSIDDTLNTDFYLYFDSTASNNTSYVGDIGDTPAQAVWDSDFIAVYHLAADPSGVGNVKDSTGNGNNNTATNMSADDLEDSLIGKGIDFSGSGILTVAGNTSLNSMTQNITVEAWFKKLNNTTSERLCGRYTAGSDTGYILLMQTSGGFKFDGRCKEAAYKAAGPTSTVFDDGNWHYAAGRRNGTSWNVWGDDGASGKTATTTCAATGDPSGNGADLYIGKGEASDSYPSNGGQDEMRLSKIARSDAWLNATFEAGRDNLISTDTPPGGGGAGVMSNIGIHSALFGGQIVR